MDRIRANPPSIPPNTPITERLSRARTHWVQLAHPFVIDMIDNGVDWEWVRHPPELNYTGAKHAPMWIKRKGEQQLTDAFVAKCEQLVDMGVIKPWNTHIRGPPKALSVAYPRAKPDGTARFLLDLKHMTAKIKPTRFKMENLERIRAHVDPGEFIVKWDLKSAFYHLRVHQDKQAYVCFALSHPRTGAKMIFYLEGLPMGLRKSPAALTALVREVVGLWRRCAWNASGYLDDLAATVQGLQQARTVQKEGTECLVGLGFLLNMAKSTEDPSTRALVLGMVLDTVRWEVTPPDNKAEEAIKLANDISNASHVRLSVLMRLVGLLNFYVIYGSPNHRQWLTPIACWLGTQRKAAIDADVARRATQQHDTTNTAKMRAVASRRYGGWSKVRLDKALLDEPGKRAMTYVHRFARRATWADMVSPIAVQRPLWLIQSDASRQGLGAHLVLFDEGRRQQVVAWANKHKQILNGQLHAVAIGVHSSARAYAPTTANQRRRLDANELSINALEAQAVILAATEFGFLDKIPNMRKDWPCSSPFSILLETDSTVVCSIIKRRGGPARHLVNILAPLFSRVREDGSWLNARFVPTECNIVADALSRGEDPEDAWANLQHEAHGANGRHEWRSSTKLRARLTREGVTLDAFATPANKVCDRFAPRWNTGLPMDVGTDGFATSWNGEIVAAIPPFPMIRHTVNKIRTSPGAKRVFLLVPLQQRPSMDLTKVAKAAADLHATIEIWTADEALDPETRHLARFGPTVPPQWQLIVFPPKIKEDEWLFDEKDVAQLYDEGNDGHEHPANDSMDTEEQTSDDDTGHHNTGCVGTKGACVDASTPTASSGVGDEAETPLLGLDRGGLEQNDDTTLVNQREHLSQQGPGRMPDHSPQRVRGLDATDIDPSESEKEDDEEDEQMAWAAVRCADERDYDACPLVWDVWNTADQAQMLGPMEDETERSQPINPQQTEGSTSEEEQPETGQTERRLQTTMFRLAPRVWTPRAQQNLGDNMQQLVDAAVRAGVNVHPVNDAALAVANLTTPEVILVLTREHEDDLRNNTRGAVSRLKNRIRLINWNRSVFNKPPLEGKVWTQATTALYKLVKRQVRQRFGTFPPFAQWRKLLLRIARSLDAQDDANVASINDKMYMGTIVLRTATLLRAQDILRIQRHSIRRRTEHAVTYLSFIYTSKSDMTQGRESENMVEFLYPTFLDNEAERQAWLLQQEGRQLTPAQAEWRQLLCPATWLLTMAKITNARILRASEAGRQTDNRGVVSIDKWGKAPSPDTIAKKAATALRACALMARDAADSRYQIDDDAIATLRSHDLRAMSAGELTRRDAPPTALQIRAKWTWTKRGEAPLSRVAVNHYLGVAAQHGCNFAELLLLPWVVPK